MVGGAAYANGFITSRNGLETHCDKQSINGLLMIMSVVASRGTGLAVPIKNSLAYQELRRSPLLPPCRHLRLHQCYCLADLLLLSILHISRYKYLYCVLWPYFHTIVLTEGGGLIKSLGPKPEPFRLLLSIGL
jgi:hypothetical protein